MASRRNGVAAVEDSMAAWLDMPDVVQLLLECSSGAVSVDGMDTDGATPLMCKSARLVFQ